MLHTFDEEGNMGWTCNCGKENTAHVSHEEVAHSVHDDGLVDPGTIGIPRCTCGTRIFLNVVQTQQEWDNIPRWDYSVFPPVETDKSVQSHTHHRNLAEHMKKIGKGPDDVKGGA